MLKNISDLINSLTNIVSGGLATLLMGLAFIAFLLSIINFLWKRRSGDDKGLNDAKSMLGWTIIALFVMVSVWGLVAFLQGALGVGNVTEIKKPQTRFNGANSTTNNPSGTPSTPGTSIPTDPCLANPGSIDCR
jgi:hypothetical protein